MVKHLGCVDYFITITANPYWEEIQDQLGPNQTYMDRPDICVRVFWLKFKAIMNDIMVNHVLGLPAGFVWVVEFQKRGLPHAHLVLFMVEQDQIKFQIDKMDAVVCAELVDSKNNPKLCELVNKFMLHGPCKSNSACMQNGKRKCNKGFPKPFREISDITEGKRPQPRRRNNGLTCKKGNSTFTNQHVVAYNPYFLQKYECHINFEVVGANQVLKYLFDYIHKGHTTANLEINVQQNLDDINSNEINIESTQIGIESVNNSVQNSAIQLDSNSSMNMTRNLRARSKHITLNDNKIEYNEIKSYVGNIKYLKFFK